MRITEGQLRRIIRQEIKSTMREALEVDDRFAHVADAKYWVLNFYPSGAEFDRRGDVSRFGGFARADFTKAEMMEMQKLAASVGGKAQFIQGQGPGAPATVTVRGVMFADHDEALAAAESISAAMSPALADRMTVSILPKYR